MDKKKLGKAKRLINRGSVIAVDVAMNHGQMFDNVKHMSWFILAVAEGI